MTPRIRLNFLPVRPQQFAISAWRRQVDPQDKKPDERFVWRYDLPEHPRDPASEKRTYLVRFAPGAGFEHFTMSAHVHRTPANAALFRSLQGRVRPVLSLGTFFYSDKAFRPRRIFTEVQQ